MKKSILIILEIILLMIYVSDSMNILTNKLMFVGFVVIAICSYIFIDQMLKSPYKNQWAKPSNILYVSYLIVNFQMILDYWLGYKTDGGYGMGTIAYSNTLGTCLVLGCVGLVAFTFGYCIKPNNYKSISNIPLKKIKAYKSSLFLLIIQIACFVLFVATIDVAAFITGSVYEDSNEFSFSNYFEILLLAANVSIVIDRIYKRQESINFLKYLLSFNKVTLVIFIIYILLRMLSGDRGPVIFSILLLFFGYSYLTRKSVKLIPLILATIIAAVFVSILGITRTTVGEGSYAERLSESYESYQKNGRFENSEEESVISATEELSASCTVNQIAVNEVRNNFSPLHYGTYQVVYLLNCIPFIPSLLKEHFSPENLSSTEFVDREYYGEFRTSSLGTSMLADFFLELDIYGVIIGMLVVGIFYRNVDEILYVDKKSSTSLLFLILTICYAQKALYLPRSTFLGEFKEIFLIVVFLYLNRLIYKYRYKIYNNKTNKKR